MTGDLYEELSSGDEPARARPARPRLPSPRPPSWWEGVRRRLRRIDPGSWTPRGRRALTVAVVVVLAVAGVGRWAWDRTHVADDASALRIQVDPSEYLLPGSIDGKGQADLLMLVRVDVAAGLGGPVRLEHMDGGGITAKVDRVVDASPWRHAVRVRLSCDQWADGRAVSATFRVGPGDGHEVKVPLDAGPNSPVHAQITTRCVQFALDHPLRLTVFSVALEPTAPVARTTWTVVNRGSTPIVLSPGYADVQLGGDGPPPLAPERTDDTVTIEAHQTASVVRTLDVLDCRDQDALGSTGRTVSLVGWSGDPTDSTSHQAEVVLPDVFVRQVFAVATDACAGGPDMQSAKADLTLTPGGAGKGTARIDVTAFVDRPGPWTATLGSTLGLHGPDDTPAGVTTQSLQGPDGVLLSASWTIRQCTETMVLPHHDDFLGDAVTVVVKGIRSYPYVVPVAVSGSTRCTPGDVRS